MGIVYPAGAVNAEVIRVDEVKILNYAFLVILLRFYGFWYHGHFHPADHSPYIKGVTYIRSGVPRKDDYYWNRPGTCTTGVWGY